MLVVVGERAPYPSDLSDEAWELIRPVITAWKARLPPVSGHEGQYEMREIVDALLYQARTTGCQWRYLSHDLPPYMAVYYYFAKWRHGGTIETLHDLLEIVQHQPGAGGAHRNPSGGWSSRPWAPSCSTDASRATTRRSRPARWR